MSTSLDKNNGRLFITHRGLTVPLSTWALIMNLKRNTLYSRLRRGWSVQAALYLPLCPGVSPRRFLSPRPAAPAATRRPRHRRELAFSGKLQSMAEWARERDMAYSTIANRRARGHSDVSTLTRPTTRGPKPGHPIFYRAAS